MQQTVGLKPAVMPSAPPLDRAQPTGTLVKDALYLAVREAQIGNPAKARDQVKTAWFQLGKVGDPVERAYWEGQIALTTAYVEGMAGDAKQLQTQALLSDADYVRGQKLTPAALQELVADNADTQKALDAAARGDNPTWAYNERKITAIPAELSEKAAKIAGGVLSPWKWALAVGALVLAVGAGGYFYVYAKTAQGVTS